MLSDIVIGPSSMPCLAYTTSFEINADKNELEDAKWHSREEVKKALAFAEYEKAQKTSATKQIKCAKGSRKVKILHRISMLKVENSPPCLYQGFVSDSCLCVLE